MVSAPEESAWNPWSSIVEPSAVTVRRVACPRTSFRTLSR